MARTKSANPTYPDAHPTAPGGMSEKALAAELIETHGYDQRMVGQMKWPEKIDAVCHERRQRELEAPATAVASATSSTDTDEDAEFDALMAEFDLLDEDEGGDALDENEIIDLPDDSPTPMSGEAAMAYVSDDDLDSMLAEMEEGQAEAAQEAMEAALIAPPSLLVKDPTGEGTLDYIFDGHMGAGPSASERWMHCTASLGASRKFLETLTINQQREFAVANEAARQGTTAHAAAEVEALVLLGRMNQDEADATLLELAVMPDTGGEAYDDEMAEYITEYTDLVNQYITERGADYIHIEARVGATVPLTGMHEGEAYSITGSADFIALPTADEPELVVGDLKYGNGIDVDVDENSQVRIYGLGALDLLTDDEGNLITDVEQITYHIVQPRLGGIKTWSESIEDLLDWRDEVLAPRLTAALFGQAEGATFEPSEGACQFCPVRGACPALAEQRITQAADLFDTIVEAEYADGPGSFPDSQLLSDERLGSLLKQVQGLTKIADELKAEAQRRLYRGGSVPGYHLVNYTPPRSWTEDAANRLDPMLQHDEGAIGLSAEMRAAMWKDPVLRTPTQALALLKRYKVPDHDRVLDQIIVVPDKRPVVAPEGDRRTPWVGRAPEDMFADESASGTDSGEESVA